MPQILKEAIVPYPAETMFNLVTDIAAYPEFLPWCSKVVIHSHSETETDATLFVQKGWVKFSFRTRNTNQRPSCTTMELLEGPFQQLNGKWEFFPLGGEKEKGTKIRFSLEYVFANLALNMTFNPVMEKLANTFLEAFCYKAQN